jgi:hypothetical protein
VAVRVDFAVFSRGAEAKLRHLSIRFGSTAAAGKMLFMPQSVEGNLCAGNLIHSSEEPTIFFKGRNWFFNFSFSNFSHLLELARYPIQVYSGRRQNYYTPPCVSTSNWFWYAEGSPGLNRTRKFAVRLRPCESSGRSSGVLLRCVFSLVLEWIGRGAVCGISTIN